MILYGWSSGGQAALINTNYINDILKQYNPNILLRVVSLGGFFVDYPYVENKDNSFKYFHIIYFFKLFFMIKKIYI